MKTKYKPTKKIAAKVLDIVDKGLTNGLGKQIPGQMCVEAAVCSAFGLPHGDNPPCVGATVRSFKIALNDSKWSSDTARSKGMRKLAIAQLGSDTIDQEKFLEKVGFKCMTKILPIILQNSIDEDKNKDFFKKYANQKDLEESIVELKKAKTFDVAKKAAQKARDAYASASASAFASASASAFAFAYAFASAYAYASAFAEKNVTFNDKILNMNAQAALEALQELKSPGCKWLGLCD